MNEWLSVHAIGVQSLVNSEEKTQAQLLAEALHFLYNSTARVKYTIHFLKQKEKYKGLYT